MNEAERHTRKMAKQALLMSLLALHYSMRRPRRKPLMDKFLDLDWLP